MYSLEREMRNYLKIIVIIISFMLAACGGGGGSSSGTTTDVRLAVDLGFDNLRMKETRDAGFYVSNTEIGSVMLTYTNDSGISTKVDITSAASGGVVELTGLATGSYYTFDIKAYMPDNTEVCDGSAEVLISANVTNNVDLTCRFQDAYAMENSVYDFLDMMLDIDETAAYEDISRYVATDFGIYDGATRELYILDLVEDGIIDLSDTGVKLDKVDVSVEYEGPSGNQVIVTIYFTDGSYNKERVWLKKENGRWKLAGNGELYYKEILAEAYREVQIGGATNIYSGFSTDFIDEYSYVTSIDVYRLQSHRHVHL